MVLLGFQFLEGIIMTYLYLTPNTCLTNTRHIFYMKEYISYQINQYIKLFNRKSLEMMSPLLPLFCNSDLRYELLG